MAKLKNTVIDKMKAEKRVSYLSKDESYDIHVSTSKRMEKYARDYSKKDKASHIAASKLLLTS